MRLVKLTKVFVAKQINNKQHKQFMIVQQIFYFCILKNIFLLKFNKHTYYLNFRKLASVLKTEKHFFTI